MTDHQPLNALDALTPAEAADFGDLVEQAVELSHRDGRVSVATIQQHLGVNPCRAARMVDALERLGLVAPEIRSRPRAAALRPLPV